MKKTLAFLGLLLCSQWIIAQEYFPKNEIKKKNNGRGSYTIKTSFNKNSTFSGPVYLPWHFVLAKKMKNFLI